MDTAEKIHGWKKNEELDKFKDFVTANKIEFFWETNPMGRTLFQLLIELKWLDAVKYLFNQCSESDVLLLLCQVNDKLSSQSVLDLAAKDDQLFPVILEYLIPDMTNRHRIGMSVLQWDYKHADSLNYDVPKIQAFWSTISVYSDLTICRDESRFNTLNNLDNDKAFKSYQYLSSRNPDGLTTSEQDILNLSFQKENLNCSDLRKNFNDFASVLQENVDSVGLFHFSGHGFSENHVQYLQPTDYKPSDEASTQCLSLLHVMESMANKREGSLNIIILDCCRDQGNFDEAYSEKIKLPYNSNFIVLYGANLNGESNGHMIAELLNYIRLPIDIESMFKVVVRALRARKKMHDLCWMETSSCVKFQFFP